MCSFIPLPVKVPQAVKWFYPGYVWDKFKDSKGKKAIYLTFDDGPIPEVTPWVLDLLKENNARATFFCIGDNVRKHPEVFKRVVAEGHSVGNHTFNHLKGWSTSYETYLENALLCEIEMSKHLHLHAPKLFRPPYGKIKWRQARRLRHLHYKIVLYDTVAYDWDPKKTGDQCAQNITKNSKSGSIVVFHDSLKAEKNLKQALPKVLDFYKNKGFEFKKL